MLRRLLNQFTGGGARRGHGRRGGHHHRGGGGSTGARVGSMVERYLRRRR